LLQAINYANNADRAKSLITELEKISNKSTSAESTPRFASFQADVGDRAAIKKLVQQTAETFGRIDVVVSNAGW
jgi:NAD(P)-dependent dehydrogenase (short-subunit alcohol dehydrogenase family)